MTILLCSSLIWSAGSLYSRSTRNSSSPFLAAAQQMLCGGTLLIIAGSATGEWRHFDPRQITMQSLGAFAYLVLIGGIIGYVSYAWLLRHCEPAKVATYAYVNPIVAVFLGAMFAGEKLTDEDRRSRGVDHRLRRVGHHRRSAQSETGVILLCYSVRSAAIGLMRVARRAGSQVARRPQPPGRLAQSVKASGSSAPTS